MELIIEMHFYLKGTKKLYPQTSRTRDFQKLMLTLLVVNLYLEKLSEFSRKRKKKPCAAFLLLFL